MRFDRSASRRVLAAYGTQDIVDQRRRVLDAVAPRRGEHVLDIGTGPGLLARQLAAAVGPAGSVAGVDLSPDMLALAGELDPGPGAGAPVTLAEADATELPYADASFDVVVSTQVYEYVADMPRALAEAHRVLRPSGRIVILDTDWDSLVWHADDTQLHSRVLAAWDQHLADPYLPRRLPALLRDAGFALRGCTSFPLLNVGYDEDTFSAGLIEMVCAFVSDRDGVTTADARAWADDLRKLGPDYFFSLNRYVFDADSRG